jgi:hypothetical protein
MAYWTLLSASNYIVSSLKATAVDLIIVPLFIAAVAASLSNLFAFHDLD